MSSEYQPSQTLPQAHCSPSHVIPAARDFHIKKGKSLSALNLERGVDLKGGCRTCGGGGLLHCGPEDRLPDGQMASSCVWGRCYGVHGGLLLQMLRPEAHAATNGPHRAAVALLSCCREAALAGE